MQDHSIDKKIINLGSFEAFHLVAPFVIGAAILLASHEGVFDIKTISDAYMLPIIGTVLNLCAAVLVWRIGKYGFRRQTRLRTGDLQGDRQ